MDIRLADYNDRYTDETLLGFTYRDACSGIASYGALGHAPLLDCAVFYLLPEP